MARTYQLPQVIVQQDFNSIPSSAIQELLTVVVGPQKRVINIGDIDEENYVAYGDYDYETSAEYAIKGLKSTDELEKDSVNVVLKNVWAKYARLNGANDIEAVTDRPSFLKLGSGTTGGFASFLSNLRASDFGNRDVKVGDRVSVNYGAGVLESRVVELIHEITAASAGSASVGPENPANQASATVTPVSPGVGVNSADGYRVAADATNAYVGDITKGIVEDTYTIECTLGGANGTAQFSFSSVGGESGSFTTPGSVGDPIAIGTRGLVIEFTTGSGSHTIGTKYTFTAKAVYTSATSRVTPAVVAGTDEDYLGSADTIYEIRVVKGGAWASSPQVVVTSSNGIDSFGAQVVSSNSAQIKLGRLGVLFTFGSAGTGLRLGDVWYVSVTAAAKGEIRTVRIADNIPGSLAGGTDLDVTFYILKNEVEVASAGYPLFGAEAWSLDEEGRNITFNSGIQVLDEEWVDGLGAQIPMDVHKAKLFVEWKALVKENSNRVISLESTSQVEALLGEAIPENPIAYAAFKALQNSGAKQVFAVAVETDDLEGYTSALAVTETDPRIYYIVPLTQDDQIINLVKSHVISLSEPENALERIAIVSKSFTAVDSLYDLKPGTDEAWSGYVGLMSGTGKYTYVTVPGAALLSDGVRVGDEFRSNFSIDALGNETYESFKVANVIDEEHLELAGSGFGGVVGTSVNPKMIQIVRLLTKDEQAHKVSIQSSSLSHRRVVNVWPHVASDGDKLVSGYFVAAAIAGLKSSVAPHQPLTNVILNGFTGVEMSSPYFTPSQLNVIAGGGTWIVAEAPSNSSAQEGAIITRHQLTTDYTDDNMSEVSITTNVDSIAKWLRDDLKVIIGQYNNHPYMINLIRTRLEYRLTYLKSNARTEKAGPQLVDYVIKKVAPDYDPITRKEGIRTKVNAEVELQLPYPINTIDLKLVVV
jgi:hypothetical protein